MTFKDSEPVEASLVRRSQNSRANQSYNRMNEHDRACHNEAVVPCGTWKLDLDLTNQINCQDWISSSNEVLY